MGPRARQGYARVSFDAKYSPRGRFIIGPRSTLLLLMGGVVAPPSLQPGQFAGTTASYRSLRPSTVMLL
eukprot:1550462-Prymnesium_polylepis.3